MMYFFENSTGSLIGFVLIAAFIMLFLRLRDRLARNFRLPEDSLMGRLAIRFMLKNNSFLERNAVVFSEIDPNDKVLEVGFGAGVGLEAAYNVLKGGNGKLYGIDTSRYSLDLASRRMRAGVAEGRVELFLGSVEDVPLATASIDRVFHCNCYYFWPSPPAAVRELARLLRPGGSMVTTLNMASLKAAQERGILKYGRPDPVSYMDCLRENGFVGVSMATHTDVSTGKEYQVIFSKTEEKEDSESVRKR